MMGTPISDQNIQKLLNKAREQIDASNLDQAETALAQILGQHPVEAYALQLMGNVQRTLGHSVRAEHFYRRSLAENPAQPNIYFSLGDLLISLGRDFEAVAALSEAVRLNPNLVEAHLKLARSYSKIGRMSAAEKCYRAALELSPSLPVALLGLANTLNRQRKPKEAEAILRESLVSQPTDFRQAAKFEYNLGLSLYLQHQFPEALAFFDSAQAKVPDIPLLELNRANALQFMGRFDEAIDCYRRALTREPLDLVAHRELNKLLYSLRRDVEFLRSYDDVATQYPDNHELVLAKADLQVLCQNYQAAQESFDRAVRMKPASHAAHDGLALVLARMNEFGSAINEHEVALKLDPHKARLWCNFAETLMRAREPKRALIAAERALELEPTNQGVLAYWGTALAMLQHPGAERLNDYERFIQVFELEPPDGYRDFASFNKDLNLYLDRFHHDRREPLDQSLRGGTQSRDHLFGKGHDILERLRTRIDEAVGTYISRMWEDKDHPFLCRTGKGFQYAASWSARLRDHGFHSNHCHPRGWISSAYYVAVPECVTDATEKQGWLKFGEPPFDAGLKDPVRRTIQPRPGTLVLFPSYMWHGTVPFHSQQTRTTIAFDLVPR